MGDRIVLILGQFSVERKALLEILRDALRKQNYIPVQLDFDKSRSRKWLEVMIALTQIVHFVIADFSDPKIVLQQIPRILQSMTVPVQPLLLSGLEEPG